MHLSTVHTPESLPYLDIEAIEQGHVKQYADRYSSVHSTEKDIFVVWDGGRNGLILRGKKGAVGSTIICLTPLIDSDYLYYFLKLNENIDKGSRHVDGNLFWNIQVPIPSLEKQKEIAQNIQDTLLAFDKQSQEADNNLLSALRQLITTNSDSFNNVQNLGDFKQAVLELAVTGELTSIWREKQNFNNVPINMFIENIKNRIHDNYSNLVHKAKEQGLRLPKDERNNKKSQNNFTINIALPDNWALVSLQDICYLITDGTHQTPTYQNDGVAFLSVKNVRPFKIFDTDIKYISQKEHESINRRCNPQRGDILYTKIGATYGYAAVNNLNYPFSIFVSLALIKPVYEYINSDYLAIMLNSKYVYQQSKQRLSGVANPDLHLIEIRDLKIPLTYPLEQAEIVCQVNKIFEVSENVNKSYEIEKQKLEELKKSILNSFFKNLPNGLSFSNLTIQIEEKKRLIESEIKTQQQLNSKIVSEMKKKINQISSLDIQAILNQIADDKEMTAKDILNASKFKGSIDAFYDDAKHKFETGIIDWYLSDEDTDKPKSHIVLKS